MEAGDAYPDIGTYALIGNCRSAALVSSRGSIDWLCWPRFDSPSVFGALLDARLGGRFSIVPSGEHVASRRYLPDTAVLETVFRTPSGVVRLVDLMPVSSEEAIAAELHPSQEILRIIQCSEGSVELDVLFDPRPDYGRIPRLRSEPGFGIVCAHGGAVTVLSGDVAFELTDHEPGARAHLTLRRGESRSLSLTFERHLPGVLAAGPANLRLTRTVEWWHRWTAVGAYGGPYGEMVRRSAVTLKLLTFTPSGAMVAAPTTSLPEVIAGERNWDYRYCWLRDASLTLRALFELGYVHEGEAFLSWLLHTTRLTWPHLQVMYDVYGLTDLPERILSEFQGYRESAPVRVGNAAADQLQLDIYGEVIDAAYDFVQRGGQLDRSTRRLLGGLGETIMQQWREPDEGIWEPRAGRAHHTHSKVMCWVGLDRLVRLCAHGQVVASADAFVRERDAIRRVVETEGYSRRLGSYVSVLGEETLDASLLLLSLMGYASPASPRMQGTARRVRERLGTGGLLYRYRDVDDGLSGGEGTFTICSFWSVANRALEGDIDRAREEFELVLSHANDVGLLAEEIAPDTGRALGNFPQAFSHVGLINAAQAIAVGEGRWRTRRMLPRVPSARLRGAV